MRVFTRFVLQKTKRFLVLNYAALEFLLNRCERIEGALSVFSSLEYLGSSAKLALLVCVSLGGNIDH